MLFSLNDLRKYAIKVYVDKYLNIAILFRICPGSRNDIANSIRKVYGLGGGVPRPNTFLCVFSLWDPFFQRKTYSLHVAILFSTARPRVLFTSWYTESLKNVYLIVDDLRMVCKNGVFLEIPWVYINSVVYDNVSKIKSLLFYITARL